MPNIVISEGLDTPWELKNTETNITAATDLESINLANQVIGTLGYTASQLFGSLKTEKDNLDKIVDAIELINEEIALFPDRVAAWDSSPDLGLSNSVLGVIEVPVPRRTISTARDVFDTNFSSSTPVNFLGAPDSGLVEERNYINTLIQLNAAEPLLQSAGIDTYKGYVYLSQTRAVEIGSGSSNSADWITGPSPLEFDESVSYFPNDMVVVRNSAGEPVNYRLYFRNASGFLDYDTLPPSRVLTFPVPSNATELQSWRDAMTRLGQLNATKALSSTIGLPEGVTPPVTMLGVSTEKFADQALYAPAQATLRANGTIDILDVNRIRYFGSYPPLSRPDLDLNKMTQDDVGKFFQDPKSDQIIYIDRVDRSGKAVFRIVMSKELIITKMTDDIKKSFRGEYAEKQILLTQRSSDQTLFVTSISQRYTTFSDMATNLLKTLMNFYNDFARNLRGRHSCLGMNVSTREANACRLHPDTNVIGRKLLDGDISALPQAPNASTSTSIRRFLARPSRESFGARGLVSAIPRTTTRSLGTPACSVR